VGRRRSPRRSRPGAPLPRNPFPTRFGRNRATWWAGPTALALAVVTFIHLGPSADAAVWAGLQVVLVALAAIDLQTRRLPNAITLPVAVTALVLRALFERSALVEVAVAGVAAFAAFWVVALITRGGLGMGDVKLAGMLGFVLGREVASALLVGVFAGGIWSLALLATRRAGMRSAIAYGPFLAFGGSAAILFTSPPSLV
jgi:leader peptidase (prepilin peptidase)/N-methyltransferase